MSGNQVATMHSVAGIEQANLKVVLCLKSFTSASSPLRLGKSKTRSQQRSSRQEDKRTVFSIDGELKHEESDGRVQLTHVRVEYR